MTFHVRQPSRWHYAAHFLRYVHASFSPACLVSTAVERASAAALVVVGRKRFPRCRFRHSVSSSVVFRKLRSRAKAKRLPVVWQLTPQFWPFCCRIMRASLDLLSQLLNGTERLILLLFRESFPRWWRGTVRLIVPYRTFRMPYVVFSCNMSS